MLARRAPESDRKYGYLRFAVEVDDYIDQSNTKGFRKDAQLKMKDKKNPTEDDMASAKENIGKGHEAFKGAFFTDVAGRLDGNFLGRGKFFGGTAGGEAVGTSATISPSKRDAAASATPLDEPEKKRKRFDPGTATKKFDSLATEIVQMEEKIQAVPARMQKAAEVMKTHSDDKAFDSYSAILKVRHDVFKVITSDKPEVKELTELLAAVSEDARAYLPFAEVTQYSYFADLKALHNNVLAATTHEDLLLRVDKFKEAKNKVAQVTSAIEKTISDIVATCELRQKRERKVAEDKVKAGAKAAAKDKIAAAKAAARAGKDTREASAQAAMQHIKTFLSIEPTEYAKPARTYDATIDPAFDGTTPCVLMRCNGLHTAVEVTGASLP